MICFAEYQSRGAYVRGSLHISFFETNETIPRPNTGYIRKINIFSDALFDKDYGYFGRGVAKGVLERNHILIVGQEEPMNCFVASALDHDDIDAIYDDAIRPVLKEFKIRPLRVDRDEHNDDIDDRIFQLIGRSQLCIADLTHARPSVYYEAGYAFGAGKPVIYIARRDHFKQRDNDLAGNLRVHFDLQMKNIIPWTCPNDAFRKRLRSRLRYVTRPILRKLAVEAAEEKLAKAFVALSVTRQMRSIRTKALNLLRAHGYSGRRFADEQKSRYDYPYDHYHLHLEKTCGKTYRQIHLYVRTALNKTEMPVLYYQFTPSISKEKYQQAERIESACVLVALRATRSTTLRSLFPSWTPLGERRFAREDFGGMPEEMPHKARIIALDGIRSIEDFSERLRHELGEWEANKAMDGDEE